MEIIYECKNCGKAFEPTCHATRQKYCSDACRIKHNNAKRYAPPGNACVQCGAAVEQSGQRGRNRRFCGDVCRKEYYINKAAEKKRTERQKPRECPNCGRDFVPMWETGSARFCSDECRVEWWREYHKVTPGSEKPNTTCGYCGREMENRTGKYCSRVCYRLGVSRIRGEKRCIWCGNALPKKANSGQKYCCTACAKAAWHLSNSAGVRQRYITARNPGAWRRQLAEAAQKSVFESANSKRILLVCGTMKLVSTDTLVNFIRYHLKSDPFDGNRYVFCNNDRTQLKWLEWDGNGFCVGSRNTEWGRYPWISDMLGTVIEITEREYEFLRSKSAGSKEV